MSVFTLARHASRLFGSWSAALEAAGLDARAIRWSSRASWSADLVIQAVKVLSARDFDLRYNNLRLKSRDVASTLHASLGRWVGPTALNAAARKHYGSWMLALDTAGVDITRMRTRLAGFHWSGDLVGDVLYRLHKAGINLNLERLLSNHRVLKVTLDYYAVAIPPSAIYLAAVDHHGSWRSALAAANVPTARERRARVTSDIAIMPHVVSWEKKRRRQFAAGGPVR